MTLTPNLRLAGAHPAVGGRRGAGELPSSHPGGNSMNPKALVG